MGFVKVKGLLGGSQEAAQEVELLVDSGSFYTVIPPALASNLGISPSPFTARAVLADKRELELPIALAYLRLSDREAVIMIGVMDVPMPLLGVSALEALGLKVNPVDGSLEPFLPFGPALFWMI